MTQPAIPTSQFGGHCQSGGERAEGHGALGAIDSMPDSPGKMAMSREMGMANTEMSKGNMRGACAHYMNAQKMSGAK